MQWEEAGRGSRLGFREKDFKVCDFCGALNLAANSKCFICGWEGRFHTDSESIQEAIQALAQEHGRLNETLFTEEVLPDIPQQRSNVLERVLSKVRRFLSGDS